MSGGFCYQNSCPTEVFQRANSNRGRGSGFVLRPGAGSQRQHHDYTPTLTSYVGDFLQELEQLHGPRDRDWTFLGLEFAPVGPETRYIRRNKGQIAIHLSDSARLDPERALWQLAHEVVHLLAPTGGQELALVVEEGLATFYQRVIAKRLKLNWHSGLKAYIRAGDLVASLLEHDPTIIRRLRKGRPRFLDWDAKFLIEAGIDALLAKDLCEPFRDLRARVG